MAVLDDLGRSNFELLHDRASQAAERSCTSHDLI
jgi:hypothetical protein